jgi:hypothetical protein
LVGSLSSGEIDLGAGGTLSNPDNDLDAFVLKFSSDLLPQVGKRYSEAGLTSDQSALKVVSSGSAIYVAGSSGGLISAGGLGLACGGGCAWLFRLNEDLVEVWGGAAQGNAAWAGLAASPEGVTALFSLSGDAVLQPGAGVGLSIGGGPDEALVWRLAEAGTSSWSFQFSQGGPVLLGNLNYLPNLLDTAHVEETPSGPLIIAGFRGTAAVGNEVIETNGASDVALLKFDQGGGLEYLRHYPGPGDQGAAGLASEAQDGRLWAMLLNAGTLDLGVGEFVHSGPQTSLVLTKLVP